MTELCIIGGGNMGSALLHGILSDETIPPEQIAVVYRSQQSGERLRREFPGVSVMAVIPPARGYLVATKVRNVREVVEAIRVATPVGAFPFIVSVAAGVTISTLRSWCGEGFHLIRAMPNTPAVIGKAMTGISFEASVPEPIRSTTTRVFNSVGRTVVVEEEQLNAVTAISGSGPAYLLLIMEAMEEAGVALGLPLSLARTLVMQTFAGTSEMALQSAHDPRSLRMDVTSPGGTTTEAIGRLEAGGVRSVFREAILACYLKAETIGTSTTS